VQFGGENVGNVFLASKRKLPSGLAKREAINPCEGAQVLRKGSEGGREGGENWGPVQKLVDIRAGGKRKLKVDGKNAAKYRNPFEGEGKS